MDVSESSSAVLHSDGIKADAAGAMSCHASTRIANGGDSKGKPDGSLEALATISPGGKSVTVVVMNRNEATLSFTITDSASGRLSKPIQLPAHSIRTYEYAI